MNTRCSICPGLTKCVQPDGPMPARYMAIGEAPGQWEDRRGIPFVGDAGEELDHTYLPLAGLDRSEVFVTNVRQCRPPQNRKPTQEEINICGSHHLPQELAAVKPSVVFLMGATACSLVPGIDLEVEHGIPRRGIIFGQEYWITPMFHPALGLHKTSAMIQMLSDWERVGEWLKSNVKYDGRVDEGTDYQLVESIDGLKYYGPFDPNSLMAVDTESHQGEFFSLQYSLRPGTGRMIMAQNVTVLAEWADLARRCPTIAFHYAPADLPIVESLFASTGNLGQKINYRDTLTEAYNLGNLQQGLKALGYRLFGVKMLSWEDLVTGPSKQALKGWIERVMADEEQRPLVEHKQLKTKVKTISKPNGVYSALKRILRHVDSTTYDPWSRLEDLGLDGYPRKGIKHCDLSEVIQYGCRDADITLRLALQLENLRQEAQQEWQVQEEDMDQGPTTKQEYQESHRTYIDALQKSYVGQPDC